MNDQGLFIDASALGPTGWKPVEGKPTFAKALIDGILAECATVEDAIALCDKFTTGSSIYSA